MKNMKTVMKLISGFSIVVVFAIIIGFMGMYGMARINSADDALYNENLLAVQYMGELRENVQHMRVEMYNYALNAGDEAKLRELKSTMSSLEAVSEELFAGYEETITEGSDESMYFTAKDLYNKQFLPIINNVYEASLRSEEEAFAIIFADSTTKVINDMISDFTNSMQVNSDWARDAVDKNTALFLTLLTIGIIALLLVIVIAVSLTLYIAKLINRPLTALTDFMNRAGTTGDISLTTEESQNLTEYTKNRDEVGQCIKSSLSFMRHMSAIAEELEDIAGGNLAVEVEKLSDSDTMALSLLKMEEGLNSMFHEINAATAQVTIGAGQVAGGSQSLAQGSTEQASSVQELLASITEVSEKTKTNAEMADKAARLTVTIRDNAEDGSNKMNEMVTAVKEINQASQNISKVIKVIDDIAFQTNILALNAAVEAARAGAAGKGFAVVAEEVRNLASKSAEAAKDTSGLISSSIEKAELGARIADETFASLMEIVSGIKESNQIVTDISKSSEEQAYAIEQINTGVEQVSQVIQQNSATAEESAAASEEMSGQASMLEGLVAQFKLKDVDVRH